MANVVINDAHLSGIAAAIREKNGSSASYKPREMAEAIALLGVTTDATDRSTYNKDYITELEYSGSTIPKKAFWGLARLKVFRSNATTVGMESFYNTAINYVYLRDAVNVGRPTNDIDYAPFYGCKIRHIDFGENIEYINLKNIHTQSLNSVVIRKTAVNDDGTFTFPTLAMTYIPKDQRGNLTLYVPAAVKHFYEAKQEESPDGNYAFFHLATIEGSEFETYGGDLG